MELDIKFNGMMEENRKGKDLFALGKIKSEVGQYS